MRIRLPFGNLDTYKGNIIDILLLIHLNQNERSPENPRVNLNPFPINPLETPQEMRSYNVRITNHYATEEDALPYNMPQGNPI